ncbi:MAG: HAMP domain-containing protein [Actinobacteria bacterium]|nr:HAMP domain-containing protein [Actinomycetota bacterium]
MLGYRTLSLRWKILIPFCLLTVLWAASGTFLLTKIARDRAEARIEGTLQERMANAGNAFADVVASHIELQRLASSTEGTARAASLSDEAALNQLLTPLLVTSRAEGISVAGPDGNELVAFWRGRDSIEVLNDGLGFSAEALSDLQSVSENATDRAILITSSSKGELFVAGGPLNQGDARVGSIAVAMSATRLLEYLEEAGAGRMALYSPDGRFLASSEGAPQLPSSAVRGSSNARLEADNFEVLVGSVIGRDEVLARTAVFQQASGVLDEVRRTAAGLALLGLLAIIAVASVGLMLARAITAPLERMANTARGIAGGDLSKRAAVRSGDEIGTLGSAFNAMADQLQASYADLESRVGERTFELEQVAKELESMGNNKSEFIAALAHELRTPLNAILGYSELLADPSFGSLKPAEVRKQARAINQSGQHLMQLINDVLDLSKIEAGKLALHVESVSVKDTIREVINLIEPMAKSKRIKLKPRVTEAPDFIKADEKRMRQILLNLLSNAVKFTREGGSVQLDATRSGRYLVVSVIDTGIGIPVEEQARIFKQFHQGGGSYIRRQEGTGLGLTLTKQLVELHGGTIEVESEVGKGSTFRFKIPMGLSAARSRRAS